MDAEPTLCTPAMGYPISPFVKNPDVLLHLFTAIGCQSTEVVNLCRWLCRAPPLTTIRVNVLRYTSQEVKKHVEEKLQKLCRKNSLNCPTVHVDDRFPELIYIKNSSTRNANNDVRIDREVVVDAACGAALLRGAHIYAPGILAMQSGTQIDELVRVYSDLDGKCKKGTNTVYESSSKLFIGTGRVLLQRYRLFGPNSHGSGIAVEMLDTCSGVPSLGNCDEYLLPGMGILQNLPSMVCVRVLDPQPGETILDMCAAPGNKTSHIAELMQDRGLVVAIDKTERKVALIRKRVSIGNYNSIRSYVFDSTKAVRCDTTVASNCAELLSPPFAPNTFDRILLDAPCSALGNRPQLVNNISTKMLASCIPIQKKLLAGAVELLKPNGVLVYSTCTINEQENEALVAWALRKYTCLRLVSSQPCVGGPGWDNSGLTIEHRNMVQRFGPQTSTTETDSQLTDSVGFFIAKFIKST